MGRIAKKDLCIHPAVNQEVEDTLKRVREGTARPWCRCEVPAMDERPFCAKCNGEIHWRRLVDLAF